MRSTHVALCSSLPLSLKGPKSLPRVPRGGEGDQGGEGSPVGSRGIPPKPAHLHYLNPRAILHPGHPTSYLGAHHRKGRRSIMRRTSLISSRRTRALRERPATDTRLPPHPFLPGDGRSIDHTRHTCLPGHSRVCATLRAYSPPATGQGDDPTPSGPRRPSRPGSTPPSLPSELPLSRRREGVYARPPPKGRKRLGFIPLSGLPRLTSRRFPVHPETAESLRSHPSEW